MTDKYYDYLLAVAETGSINKAAKQLSVSQPAVSMGISQLEKLLGYPLLNRDTNPIVPTAEGALFLSYLTKDRELYADCMRRIEELHGNETGSLSIGGPMIYLEAVVCPVLPDYQVLYPDASITITADDVPDCIRSMQNGKLDGFICAGSDLPDDLEAVFLKTERLFLCFPKEWDVPVFTYDPAALSTFLTRKPMIFLKDNQPLQKTLHRFLKETGIHPCNRITTDQVSTVLRLIKAGAGMGIVTGDALSLADDTGQITCIPVPDEIWSRNVTYVHSRNRYHTKAENCFIELLKGAPGIPAEKKDSCAC